MKSVGLIGLGSIVAHYTEGLNNSSFLRLCAVSDKNPQAKSRSIFNAYPFFEDYKEMLEKAKPDMVIICTPPQTHFDIALYCLNHETDVLMEKPITLDLKEFDLLCDIAEKKGRIFKTLFHWQGGTEVEAFTRDYPLHDIKEISVLVQDPYSDDEKIINPRNRSLMGAWIDSGVNVLSMLQTWLPFEKVEILRTEKVDCQLTNLPIFACVKLMIDGVIVTITIDWISHRNLKETVVKFSDKTVRISHSEQSIVDGDNIKSYERMSRLDQHYFSLFSQMDGTSNVIASRLIHQVLLEVNDNL